MNTKIKILIIILIVISASILYFTGIYDDLRIKTINYIETKINKKGIELITGKGSLIDKTKVDTLEDSGISGSKYTFNSIDNAYYKVLEDKEKELYKQIYANIVELKKKFRPIIKINKDELGDIIEAVYYDHPELFWVSTNYSYKYIDEGEVVQITLSYNSTSKDIAKSKELFEESANRIIEEASNFTDDYLKEKYVHDTLIKMNEYDKGEKLNQSAYSAIVTGKTVCSGYSRAFMYIMNKIGIRTYYISGDSSGDHSWNIVEIEDEYYNVDLTMDDQNGISYRYFNVPDSVFSKTHIRKDLSIYLPVCRGSKYYNYMQKVESRYSEDNEEIIDPKEREEIYNYDTLE